MSDVSPHFSWAELTRTGSTELQAINRQEAEQYRAALTALATTILEPIRAKFGAVKINSAFRGASVNAKVGGSKTSQHLKGEAADIVCPAVTVEELHRWIVTESGLPYGQCILEKTAPARPYSWVHVSLGEPWRRDTLCRQALVYDGAGHYTTWEPK
jgi:zinc D-Ala-D-Ala carboxypeptidase